MKPSLPLGVLVLCAVLATGCGEDRSTLIWGTSPLNGSTLVRVYATAKLELASWVGVNATEYRVVLYDTTNGGRRRVGGQVAVKESMMEYKPSQDLPADHDFALEMLQSAVKGSDFDDKDGSEWPDEDLTWPYQLRFSTRSAPRVRAAYLESSGGGSRLTLRFSQDMDVLVTGPVIQILDGVTYAALTLQKPVWSSNQSVQVDTDKALDGSGLYILKVGESAIAADGSKLDGNANGKAGETKDAFCAKFTGIQSVIFSRLGKHKPSSCP